MRSGHDEGVGTKDDNIGLHGLSVPGWERLQGLVAGFLGRSDPALGEESEALIRQWLPELSGRDFRLVYAQQVHGDAVITITQETHEMAGEADGLATHAPGVLLMVYSADCVPMLLVDPTQRVCAAVHAGWRGTLAGIAPRAVGHLRQVFGVDPAMLQVALGPAIGSCCYAVEQALAERFTRRWGTTVRDSWVVRGDQAYLDLRRINARLLEQAGVPPTRIRPVGGCTACRTDRYYSYRREGRTGRQISFVGWLD